MEAGAPALGAASARRKRRENRIGQQKRCLPPRLQRIRPRGSADLIPALVRTCLEENPDPKSILILTPYRAQRSRIKARLQRDGITGVQVTTIHRAQGGERRVIIMDPVLGTHKANGELLINVGISRAQARLILLLSDEDRKNEIFARISALSSLGSRSVHQPRYSQVISARRPFGEIRSGDKLSHAGRLYVYEGLTPDMIKVHLRDAETGERKTFIKNFVFS